MAFWGMLGAGIGGMMGGQQKEPWAEGKQFQKDQEQSTRAFQSQLEGEQNVANQTSQQGMGSLNSIPEMYRFYNTLRDAYNQPGGSFWSGLTSMWQ